MAESDDAPPNETPIQRALRLKKAAQSQRSRPGGRQEDERAAAARSASKSKPWMKRG